MKVRKAAPDKPSCVLPPARVHAPSDDKVDRGVNSKPHVNLLRTTDRSHHRKRLFRPFTGLLRPWRRTLSGNWFVYVPISLQRMPYRYSLPCMLATLI